MDYRGAIEAVIDAAVDTVLDGFGGATAAHDATREQGAALRHREAARQLFGAKLDDALTALVGEARRRATVRCHPRYSTDQLVNELDDAEATLGREIVAAQKHDSPRPSLALMLALIRVEAISAALGEAPIAGQKIPRSRKGAPIQRRRVMTAADIPGEVAQLIFAAARGDDMADVIAGLHALETTRVNAGAIVTKVKVVLKRDGIARARKLAGGLRDAGVIEVIPAPDAETTGDLTATLPASHTTVTPPAPATGAVGLKSIKRQVVRRHAALPAGGIR